MAAKKDSMRANLAGAEGFEPPMPGPKPGALPLGYAPKRTFFMSSY